MNRDNEYIRIDLLKIAEGMIGRLWMIILSMVLCGAMAFSYASFWLTPMYQARALMYVNNNSFAVGSTSFSISASEISAAKSLVDTYLVILETRLTLNEVIERGSLNRSYEELCRMINAESVNETEVFSVSVTSPDPQEAEHIANTIALVLPDKISGVVEGSSVSIVDYAVVPSSKVSPSISKYTIVGLLAGMLLSCAVIAVIEILDDQIHSESYLLENYGDIPLLSVVPDLTDSGKSKGYYYYRRGYYRSHDYRYGEYQRADQNSQGNKAAQRRDKK